MSVSEGTTSGTPCYFVDLAGGKYTVKFSKKTMAFLGADDVHLGEWIEFERADAKEFMERYPKIYSAAVQELAEYVSKKKKSGKGRK